MKVKSKSGRGWIKEMKGKEPEEDQKQETLRLKKR